MSQLINENESKLLNESKCNTSGLPKKDQCSSSNVHHIPILVEGRDKPILNTDETITKSNDFFKDRNKIDDVPVKKFIPHSNSSSLPRNIPIKVINQKSSQHNENNPKVQKNVSTPTKIPYNLDSLNKIASIQNEVLKLMDKVDKFQGISSDRREYIYLDEMLTQNLLKLDTIDTEGKESIKAARKEAINSINKCIAVLEAKVNSASSK